MRTLSAAYLAAAKAAGRYPDLYAIIYGTNDTLTISGKDAIISANITRGDTAKPAYFEVGRAISSSAALTVDRRRMNDETLIVSGAKIEIYAEFDNSAGTAIASAILATMYISGYDNQDKDIGYISAVDRLVYTGGDFNPDGLTYPVDLEDMLTEAFDQSGLSGVSVTLPVNPHVNSAPYQAEEPVADGMSGDPYTCRDVIGKIAGMQMSDLFMDADGQPKVYAYGAYITGAITDDMIYDLSVSAESFAVNQVIVYKNDKRMPKDDAHYQKLPYNPRFEDMDDISSGGAWWDEIVARAHVFVRTGWTTCRVTFAGVGELEPGDFVEIGSAAIPAFVSGVEYEFSNAAFRETVYSFAYTLEEYYQAPSKATVVSTDVKPSAGDCIGENIGNHSARINDLENNTVTEADPFGHNLLVNSGHTLNSCMDVLACGRQNTATRATQFLLSGVQNEANSNSYAGFMTGTNNTSGNANGNGDQRSLMYGSHNVGKSNTDTLIGGEYNNSEACQSCAIIGSHNTASNAVGAIIVGYYNIVNNYNFSFTTGSYNTGAAYGITGGAQNLGSEYGLTVGVFSAQISGARLVVGNGTSANDRKNSFYVTADGTTYAKVYNTTGADYAEYFEWADGNPDGEDRRGLLVKLVGDKIAAAHGDEILGAVSARPSVIGNACEEHWHGKYKLDVFGDYILDDDGKPQLSDDYDPEREYIPRSKRREWAPVGMVGRLIICDNGKCEPGGYVSARQGIGVPTFTETRARCIRRLDGSHIEIIVR